MNKSISERNIYPGQIVRHFKGKLYQIVTIAIHSETNEKLVIYQQLYGQYKVYARPYDMFVSEVDHDKYPDIQQRYRFEPVNMDGQEKQNEQEKPKESSGCQSSSGVQHNSVRQSGEDVQKNRNVAENTDGTKAGTDEIEGVNPYLMLFLDADTYEEKRNILINIKGEMTDRLIDDIAVSMDVTVDKGEIDERFASLLSCIDTMVKFEVNRLR